MRFPPYAYVPGLWPHPTRDPDGHAFGREAGPAMPLDADAWRSNETYLEGIELFDRGYYWEAHEAWERCWIATGRTGPVADLLRGLILLAAVGVKVRQGRAPQAARLGARASDHLERVRVALGTDVVAGLALRQLQALARQARAVSPYPPRATAPVVVVFDGSLVDAPVSDDEPTPLAATLAYHRRSRHLPSRFARSAGYMDWDTQPDPFRHFEGAPVSPLPRTPVGPTPLYEPTFRRGRIAAEPVEAATVGRLFQDSLALSAWKEIPGARWSLRVNPSSGNLHPTEAYLVAGPIPGVHDTPAVHHYAPHDHAIELRTELLAESWDAIRSQLPPDGFLVGLTSIHWREAWKYGERAFRYCQHDVGHALGCICVAAAGLGWDARLLEGVCDDDLAALLGIGDSSGPEAEHPACLVAVFPVGPDATSVQSFHMDADLATVLRRGPWRGRPNQLSPAHHDWPAIDEVAAATRKRRGSRPPSGWTPLPARGEPEDSPLSLRRVIHQRRSAVALDGRSGITRSAFHQILLQTLPATDQVPFTVLPWPPCIDLLVFVHRVADVTPGLYALVRDPERVEALRQAMDPGFAWTRSGACPAPLELYLLEEGDARRVARQTSCDQAIAADGVFAVAMLAEYRDPLRTNGPWFYRRLHWEAGVVGQALYLEAEASGIRGTGIGCFFDALTHRTFGLAPDDDRFQVLYHFTMGGPVDDPRLQTLAPYEHLDRRAP